MEELLKNAFYASSIKEGLDYFYDTFKNKYKVDVVKLYLISSDNSFLTPYYIYGSGMNLGSLAIHEKESMVVSSYLKNEDFWIPNIEKSKYSENPFFHKENIKSFIAIPFINQGICTMEFHSILKLNPNDIMFIAKSYLTILLSRFYFAGAQEEVKKYLDKMKDQISFSYKLSYIGELASALVHEIKNPLTTINLLINNLHETFEHNPVYSKDLEVVREEIERISRLLTDFLKYAKPSKPSLEEIKISEIIAKTLSITDPVLKNKAIRTEISFDDEPFIKADPDQLKQIILNLTLNAMEAVKKDTGRIVYKGKRVVKQGINYYNFIIEDNGPGIKKEILSKIFEPFFSESGKGAGLGLSIVHRLVENQGGFIEAYNQLNKGACFSIFFPL